MRTEKMKKSASLRTYSIRISQVELDHLQAVAARNHMKPSVIVRKAVHRFLRRLNGNDVSLR